MASATADRLSLLAQHIELSLRERSRAKSLNIEPETRNTLEISRSLDTLQQGIEQLEREQTSLEERGDLSSKELQEREDVLIKLRRQSDDLFSKFQDNETSGPASSSSSPSPHALQKQPTATLVSSSPPHRREIPFDEAEARDALMGIRRTPSAMRKSVRFSDNVETEQADNVQVLQMHRRIMEEQDESLDRLSESISRQRELSIQIGDELDSHVQLLDEVDGMADRHQSGLDRANKSLKTVTKKAKEHGSLVVIIVLIIILLLLIIILK